MYSYVLTFYTDMMAWFWLGCLPVEKQTGSSEASELNHLSTGTSSSDELAPGSFWWKRGKCHRDAACVRTGLTGQDSALGHGAVSLSGF